MGIIMKVLTIIRTQMSLCRGLRGAQRAPLSPLHNDGCKMFVLHILYFPESSNKTENICGNPYEANIGKSRVNKDKVIKSPLYDLLCYKIVSYKMY